MDILKSDVLKRAKELESDASRLKPFSQLYNNLNERHSILLDSYNNLVVEFNRKELNL